MGDQAEWAFQQQLIARMQAQQADEDDEAERAWQAALAAQQGGSSFGSGLLDPKGKGNSMPASLANVFQQPTDVGLTQEEIEEEAERAWREALALQGGDEPMDEEAERAWQEALEAQQEELDLKDDEYYEELYRNTRINEGNKVNLEKEIIDLNEQRWKLRDKKAEYYSGMKDLMESSKALDVLRGTARTGKPLKGILKKRLERVKIDRRLTLRMTRSPIREGIPRKRVGFILPEEVDAQAEQMMRMKNQEVEKLMSKSRPDDNEEEFLEMSLQFIQDFKEEEERLKQESEEIKRMEEQVARLEAELAREGIALAQKYNGDNNHTTAPNPNPIRPQPKQQPDALEDAKNADLPARIKRGTKGFGGVFIDEVHKMLGEEELQKIEARIAGIAQEDAEDIANEGEDEEDKALEQAADPALSARIKRGTKGFGGVFINEVHRMLEEEKKNEAANGTGSPPVPHRNPPAKPAPAAGGPKPGPAATTKPAPAAGGTGMRLQLDKINKEEEQRRAAEAAAKKEEDDRKNQERLKQAAEARKILVSPRPATLPSTSPRGATPTTPAKPQPTTSPRQPVPTPTHNNTTPTPPVRGGNPPATNNTTQQPPATTDPKKPWNAPAPTPRYGTSNPPPSRPERSLSDPGSPKPQPGAGGPSGVGGYSSTAQRLEAKQAPPQAGGGSGGIGGRPSPQPPKPAPAAGSGGTTQPPSPRALLSHGAAGAAASSQPATNGSPKFYGPKPGAGSFIIKRTPTTPPAGTIPLASTAPITATPPTSTTPTSLAPPTTSTNATSPTSPRAKPGPVKPLNHPEPVKRGVARPSNIDPTISAKANFFEQKQQSSEPVLSEEVLQRRARLEMFKTKVLAKNAGGQDNLKSPRVNS